MPLSLSWSLIERWYLDARGRRSQALSGHQSAKTAWQERVAATAYAATIVLWAGCVAPPEESSAPYAAQISVEVEAAVWAFHAADTAMDAEAVIGPSLVVPFPRCYVMDLRSRSR